VDLGQILSGILSDNTNKYTEFLNGTYVKKLKDKLSGCKEYYLFPALLLEGYRLGYSDINSSKVSKKQFAELCEKYSEVNKTNWMNSPLVSFTKNNIIENKDKSGIVSLPYGVEGICPSKHLKKADGSNAKVEDTLDFKVIEFNKDSKKIVVSHTRTFEEGEDRPTAASTTAGKPGAKKSGGAGAGNATSQAVKANNSNNEKSTLGDLDALAELKEKMEKGN
jgi:hypothetical protein